MNEQEPKLGMVQEIPELPIETIERLRKEVISKIDKRFLMSDTLISFVSKVRDKHPDWRKWLVLHVLIDSSPPDDVELIKDDFPGEDSAVGFLKSVLDKK